MEKRNDAILLIEDCESDALLIQQTFRKALIRNPVTHARTALEALKFLESLKDSPAKPIFVLLDLSLPDLNGYEVLRWIRRHPEYKLLPVIVISGSNNPLEPEVCQLLGANIFFQKSLSFEHLGPMVRGVGAYWLLQTISG
jgi:CheY-like chemotaxis protein